MARNVETKTQMLRRAHLRRIGKSQGTGTPYFGFVKEYNASSDTTLVDSHGGRRILFNPQPHLGRTAWMRVAPESGMGTLLITRSDTQEPENMRWWHTDTKARLQLFRENVDALLSGSGELISDEAFRPLQSGEVDIASRGGAQLFLGNRPHLDMRAGIIRLTLDQDETEISSKAPIHVRAGYQFKSGEVGDEERFGVVKRPNAGSTIDRIYVDPDGNRNSQRSGFAKEYLMKLTNPQPSPPETLFDIRMGHVIDDVGIPYQLDDSGEKLRARAEYFTTSETSVLAQLDELGNFKIELPVEATTGGKFILPSGNMVVEVGLVDPSDFKRSIGRNEEVNITADKIQNIGNNDSKTVGNIRRLTIVSDEFRVLQANSDEQVAGNKSIKVTGNFTIQSGAGQNKMGFSGTASTFETQTLTILATKEIIFESPSITFNTPSANFTGALNVNGPIATNASVTAPNLAKKDFSGTKGGAGPIPAKSAIRT